MTENVSCVGGKLIHPKITDKVNSKIEKGALDVVNALVIHQTGANSAESSLSSYDNGSNGAHFLISKDGVIYQTAQIDQKCWHVGKTRVKCLEMKSCTPEEFKTVNALLFKKGESYTVRVKSAYDREATKTYPDRYPNNDDAIGIEIVGAFDSKAGAYETVNREQNASLVWLVEVLTAKLSITMADDVYRHGTIGYKQPTEASTAQWKVP
ncbi:peptidoglycan recognition family protein [Nevskia sp.]|uniref:peptidoglycan recognition protein family protein n=1 Tax=Nevskia sp. TaxID=1929292 RepID=UPI0025EAAB00|nr:peptidoglycan recognition family protein [Nevskia sp.]